MGVLYPLSMHVCAKWHCKGQLKVNCALPPLMFLLMKSLALLYYEGVSRLVDITQLGKGVNRHVDHSVHKSFRNFGGEPSSLNGKGGGELPPL